MSKENIDKIKLPCYKDEDLKNMVTMDEIETNKYTTVEKLVKLDYLEQVIERKISKIKESKNYSVNGYFKHTVKRGEIQIKEKQENQKPIVIDIYQDPDTEEYSLKPRASKEKILDEEDDKRPRKRVNL